MSQRYVLDTHALVWHLEGNPKLGPRARQVLEDPSSQMILPVIVLAEACWAIEHNRVNITSVLDLLRLVDADPRLAVVPLDYAIVSLTTTLASVGEMHDRQIVATALRLINQGEQVAILTKDANITSSGLAPVIW